MAAAITESFQATGDRVHLVCTGALTNAALLVTLFPEIVTQCDVTIMGGALGIGNTGPVQEFNIMVRCVCTPCCALLRVRACRVL